MDRNLKCGVLLTDLSKAFDCLLHDLLIAKLKAYGFDHQSLKLINSLTGRFQRVKLNESFSEWSPIEFGVPQGSNLGPEIFNYSSNDFFLFLILDTVNFADDNSQFAVGENTFGVLNNLEIEAKSMLDWFKHNGFCANPKKIHLLLSDKNDDLAIDVNDNLIKNSSFQKLLGIKIDSKLTFNEHVPFDKLLLY